MSLIECIFKRPAVGRVLSFADISSEVRIPLNEVSIMVCNMNACQAKLMIILMMQVETFGYEGVVTQLDQGNDRPGQWRGRNQLDPAAVLDKPQICTSRAVLKNGAPRSTLQRSKCRKLPRTLYPLKYWNRINVVVVLFLKYYFV